MMSMMGGMGALMLVGLLLVAVVIGVAVYLAVRGAQAWSGREPDALELLRRRLASGELTTEEYYERESALREAQPKRRRR